jgi:hypothetical protein
MKTVIRFRVPSNAGNYLSSWATSRFSIMTQLHAVKSLYLLIIFTRAVLWSELIAFEFHPIKIVHRLYTDRGCKRKVNMPTSTVVLHKAVRHDIWWLNFHLIMTECYTGLLQCYSYMLLYSECV